MNRFVPCQKGRQFISLIRLRHFSILYSKDQKRFEEYIPALRKPRVAKLKLKCLKFSLQLQIEERCAELILSDDKLRDVCQRLLVELNRGLNKDTNKEATVKCFPTYVRELPNGEGKLKILLLKTFRLLFYSIGYS